MLKGTLIYTDKEFSTPVEMTVYAKDTGVLNMYMVYEGNSLVNETAVKELWDSVAAKDGTLTKPVKAEDFGDSWRRLNIKKASKLQTNLRNTVFAARVAALIRYCEEVGIRKGVDDLNEGDEKVYSSEFIYNVEGVGEYRKSLGYFTALDIKNNYIMLKLEPFDEAELETQMFCTLKAKDKYGNVLSKTPIKNIGFALNEATLGFKYEPLCTKDETSATAMFGLYSSMEEIEAAHPDKNYKWLRGRKYEIVTDETLDAVMAEYNAYDGIIAVDTETSGLKITFLSREGHGDQLVGICLSKEEGTGHYFPVQMKHIPNLCNGDHWLFMERYMKKFCETHKFVTHNLSFDWKVFYIYGINLNSVFDTMLAYGVTKRYEQANFEYGLKDLTHNIFGWDMIELSDMVYGGKWGKGENSIRFWDLPYELVKNYAPTDADMTLTLYNYVKKTRLLESYRAEEVFNIELVYAKVIAYSEFYGYHIDIDNLPKLEETIENNKEECKKQLFEMAGEEFNPNSTKDLVRIMYDKLGIPDVSHKRSTDKEALKELAGMTDINGKPLYPFAAVLKSYRDSEGIYKNFIKRKDEFLTPEGYIFPHVFTFGTNTGRVSVKEPNYQSYSDAMKKFVQPRPGFKMWDSDFSQIEYRVLCSMAHEPALIEAFSDPDMDYHTYQAARMFGVPYGAVTKQMRQQCKGINFGLPYGMGDASLGARIYGARNQQNTQKAAKLRELYFEGQDNIRKFFDTVRDEGVKNGYTRTLFGRLRYYHKGTFSESQIRRQAGNHCIQGCIMPDTLIQTLEYGVQPIKNIVNAHLHVWDGKQWTEGDITSSGKKRKCIVHFRGGMSIACSPIHKFLVRSRRGNDRFVECKDLVGITTNKNSAHRVVVSQDYVPSAYKYVSDRSHADWYGKAYNANNVFLDDIKDSFIRGVVLGRLASDGNISKGERCVVRQIVAEHEFDVYEYLKEAMKPLNCTYTVKELREDRSERMADVTVRSKTFTNEIRSLDIRHKIDDRIFADTEMLRGFLRGMFDGDGGVTGKQIALVQGVQDDFEPLMLDIQKALLFFGIRSYYRKYEDRYVLGIRVKDTQRFLDVIGFINKEKQEKGRALKHVLDEHIFGTCLTVESVEITDEYVDMYDVCNTDRGYYVANGVVTHNTAADVYKLACCRVFQMLEQKGWLDKVMLNAFIHDEILGEVSEEIDFYEFVEEWRKAFEVPIEGFCKLYAGLGIGNSWYEAKKADWPPQLIDIIVNSPNKGHWDNNGQKMIDWVKDAFYQYGVDRVRTAFHENIEKKAKGTLTDAERIIKPVIDAFLREKVNDYANTLDNLDELSAVIGKPVTKGKKGLEIADLQDWIKLFCHWQNIPYEQMDLQDAAVVETAGKTEEKKQAQELPPEMTADVFLSNAVKNFGFMLDQPTQRLYLNAQMITVLNNAAAFIQTFGKTEGTYRVTLVDVGAEQPVFTDTNVFVMSKDILLMQTWLQSAFAQYLKVVMK